MDHRLRCAKISDLLPAIPDSDEQRAEGFSPFNPVAPDPSSAHPSLPIAQSLSKMQNPFRPYCTELVKALEIICPMTDPVVNHLPKMHIAGRFLNPRDPWQLPPGFPEEELFLARIFFDTVSRFNLFLTVELYIPWGSDICEAFHQIDEQFQDAEEGHRQAARFNLLTSQGMLEMVSQPVKLASLNARFSKDSRKTCFWPFNGAVCWRSFLDFHSKEIDRISLEEFYTIPMQKHSGTRFLQYLCRDFPFLVEILQDITRDDLTTEEFKVTNILILKMARHSSVEAQYSLVPEPFLRLLHLELIIWGKANSQSLKDLFALHDNYHAAARSTSAVADKLYHSTSIMTKFVMPNAVRQPTLNNIQEANSKGTNKKIPGIVERLTSLSDYLGDIAQDSDLGLAMNSPRPSSSIESIYGLLEELEDKVVELNRFIFGYECGSRSSLSSEEAPAKSLDEGSESGKPLTLRFERRPRPIIGDSAIPEAELVSHRSERKTNHDPEPRS